MGGAQAGGEGGEDDDDASGSSLSPEEFSRLKLEVERLGGWC